MTDSFTPVTVTVNAMTPEARAQRPLPMTRVVLGEQGAGFDALRFTAPDDAEAYDLRWIFFTAAPFESWYIQPARGTMKGFRNFRIERNAEPPVAGVDGRVNLIRQSLGGGEIKGGETYIMHFSFPPGEVCPVYQWIDLTPRPADPLDVDAPVAPMGDAI